MRVVRIMSGGATHQVSRPAPLGNMFSHRPSKFEVIYVPTREEAIRRWEMYVRGDRETVEMVRGMRSAHKIPLPEEMLQLIKELPEDAVLGCWCAPEPCHADIIMKIWKELHKEESV